MSSSDDDDSSSSGPQSPQPAQPNSQLSEIQFLDPSESEDIASDASSPTSTAKLLPSVRTISGGTKGTEDPRDNGNEEEEQTSESEEERPNKYHGPPLKWRRWTEAERSLASSLDKLRASDLSLHLYNAHALKARLRKPRILASNWQNKRRWLTADDDDDDTEGGDSGGDEARDSFRPPRGWTAWPLPAAVVPREGEKVGYSWDTDDERWTIKCKSTPKASAQLEEVLMGQVLRKAKDMLRERPWADEANRHCLAISTSSPSATHPQASSPVLHQRAEVEMEEDVNYASKSNLLRFEPEGSLRPTVIADDEEAHKALRPSLRHILTRLDDILMGLHHTRQSCTTAVGETESETEGETALSHRTKMEKAKKVQLQTSRAARTQLRKAHQNLTVRSSSSSETDSSISPKPRAKGKTNSRSGRKSSFAPAHSASNSSSGSESQASESPHPTPKKRPRRQVSPATRASNRANRQAALGLRDWSEVLGVAALVGWDEQVISRAAARCSSLFGEGMSFRTFQEGDALSPKKDKSNLTEYRPSILLPTSALLSSSQPREKEQSSSDGSGAGYSEGEAPKASTKQQHLCPVTECERSRRPFARIDNLQRHMKTLHGLDKDGMVMNDKAGGTMVGGVHNDGFLQPIPARRGWRGGDIGKRAIPKRRKGRRAT